MNESRIIVLSEFWKIYETEGIKNAIEYLQLTRTTDDDDEFNHMLSMLSL
jgi:hypothetical protein